MLPINTAAAKSSTPEESDLMPPTAVHKHHRQDRQAGHHHKGHGPKGCLSLPAQYLPVSCWWSASDQCLNIPFSADASRRQCRHDQDQHPEIPATPQNIYRSRKPVYCTSAVSRTWASAEYMFNSATSARIPLKTSSTSASLASGAHHALPGLIDRIRLHRTAPPLSLLSDL